MTRLLKPSLTEGAFTEAPAAWTLCISSPPPDSGTWSSQWNAELTFIWREEFGPLSNSPVFIILSRLHSSLFFFNFFLTFLTFCPSIQLSMLVLAAIWEQSAALSLIICAFPSVCMVWLIVLWTTVKSAVRQWLCSLLNQTKNLTCVVK